MSDDMPHDHGSQAPAGRVRSDRILIADDDSAMRSLLRAALVRAGFEVEEARDGIEVLQLVRAVRYGERPPIHVMVSDVWMPGRSGLDLLQSLRVGGVRPVPGALITNGLLELTATDNTLVITVAWTQLSTGATNTTRHGVVIVPMTAAGLPRRFASSRP